MKNILEVLEKVKELAIKVGKMQKENLGRKDLFIETKSTVIDMVTEIDKKSEKMIIEFINREFPTHNILAEESGVTMGDSEYTWVVDPLDGTTNYSQGLPIFCVSIALQHDAEGILGVVYAPMTDQLFYAAKGDGAFLNGAKIEVSKKTELQKCVLASGFPYDIATNPVNNVNYFNYFITRTRAVRRMGAAAYDLALVAAGRFDGFWEVCLKPWDVAAAAVIIEEAGGKIVHFRDDRDISIIAGNAEICEIIHDSIKLVDSGKI